MNVRTTATELARFVASRGGAWQIDGEAALASLLPSPSPAHALVEVLSRSGALLSVLAPEPTRFPEEAFVPAAELGQVAHVIDGFSVFQLAWVLPDGAVTDSWLLAEQPARVADAAAARGIFSRLRSSRTTRRS